MFDARCVRNFYLLCCLSALAACSNGRGSVDTEQPPPSGGAQTGFSVSGTVTGLDGDGLVVQLNGGNDLAVPNNGTFTFTSQLADAATYSVAVLTQPTGPSQTCTIGNANGTIAAANVTNVAITCATGAFALRVNVTGLAGTGLVLQNNGADDLAIIGNGESSFPTPYASGAGYNVTVKTPPSGPAQSCSVTSGTGTIGAGDVTVAVACATGQFSISVTVSGLAGSGLELQNNARDDLTITGNGTFQFGEALASGAPYDVRVTQSPTNPTQGCGVDKGSGTVGAANVTDVTVTCMTNSFTVGGAATGLAGTGLKLRLNDGPPLDVFAHAPAFTFPTPLASGTNYVVTFAGQPSNPAQTCAFERNTDVGRVENQNVNNVAIKCTTRIFSIGGTVQNLEGRGLVLQKNGGDDRRIASDGQYTFQTKQASGTDYAVKVGTPPTGPSQTCTIANANGKVGDGDITSVDVTCARNSFRIGVTVSGLLGSGLVLMNNGGDDLPVTGNGTFQFATPVASGGDYDVQVRTPPGTPTQACAIDPHSGTVGDGDVSLIVSCSTSNFTIGGSLTNLAGSGLVLQNNGTNDLHLDSGASEFTFTTPLPSGSPYSVTVLTQPSGPTQQCDVANPSGTIGSDRVTNVQVSCVTTQFSVGVIVTGLHGGGLVLLNNGGDALSIGSNGEFKFPTSLRNGDSFNVLVATQPTIPAQICAVNPVSGIIAGADVLNIDVSCVDSE